ncbi:MAG: hypothetical protein QM679_07050 [Patulibacter sp.]
MKNSVRALALTAATTAALLGSASGASAGISVPQPTTSPDSLTVTLSTTGMPSGAAYYALAECNVNDATPANWGLDCWEDSGRPATGPKAVPSGVSSWVHQNALGTANEPVPVQDAFDDYSFVPLGTPQWSTTACDATAGSDQCAVVVSWYSSSYAFLDAEKADITF